MDPQIPDAIKEEWWKLFPAARYSIIFFIFIFFSLWFDKFIELNFYESIHIDILAITFKQLVFGLSILSIIILFLFLLLERLFINIKIIILRIKYPIKQLNRKFYLIAFKEKLCLLDNVRHELRWIKNWQTALDLDFVGEWTKLEETLDHSKDLIEKNIITKDGKELKLSDFKYVDGILTQGSPGT